MGLTPFFEKQIEELNHDYLPARVILEHKHLYRIVSSMGELLAEVSGSYAFRSEGRMDYPAVGDWVLAEKMPGEGKAIIHHLLQRKSAFIRQAAGTDVQQQIVAANVDIALIVMSMNDDYNSRRLERYLTAAWDSGATPVVLLTKADLCDDREAFLQQAQGHAIGVDCLVTSTVSGEGIDMLKDMLKGGVTGALLGSSGAGKSSIINALTEKESMKVAGIREDDAKGRHTTTHRELVSLPGGGSLIDTPGMRELKLWEAGDSLDSSFQEIETLAEDCRFRDCTHKNEPGCAVRQAVDSGELEEGRLHNYFKLQRESAYLEKKIKLQQKIQEKRTQKKRRKA